MWQTVVGAGGLITDGRWVIDPPAPLCVHSYHFLCHARLSVDLHTVPGWDFIWGPLVPCLVIQTKTGSSQWLFSERCTGRNKTCWSPHILGRCYSSALGGRVTSHWLFTGVVIVSLHHRTRGWFFHNVWLSIHVACRALDIEKKPRVVTKCWGWTSAEAPQRKPSLGPPQGPWRWLSQQPASKRPAGSMIPLQQHALKWFSNTHLYYSVNHVLYWGGRITH